MRQKLSEKNVAKIRAKTGLPIVDVLVRGGTGHRKDLILDDGRIVCLWPDGTMEESSFRREVSGTGTVDVSVSKLHPIGAERIFNGCIFRVDRHVDPSRAVDGRFLDASPESPKVMEMLEPIGRVVDGEKRYFDGRVELIREWAI